MIKNRNNLIKETLRKLREGNLKFDIHRREQNLRAVEELSEIFENRFRTDPVYIR